MAMTDDEIDRIEQQCLEAQREASKRPDMPAMAHPLLLRLVRELREARPKRTDRPNIDKRTRDACRKAFEGRHATVETAFLFALFDALDEHESF